MDVSRLKSLLGRTAVILFLVTATACVEKAKTGVSLQNLRADIVFGVKDEAGPANFGAPETRIEESVGFDTPLQTPAASRAAAPPQRAPVICPQAARGAAPPEEASPTAKGTPPEGAYNWKYEGTQELASAKGLKFRLSGFERRQVGGLVKVSDNEFLFGVSQVELSGSRDVVVTIYRVKAAAASARAPQTDVKAGDPERGLAIAGIDRYDSRTGAIKSSFRPRPAVLLLPLPILPAEEFQSVGVQPGSSDRLQVQGKVTKRQAVDACGELIDGWTVEMTQTLSTADGGEATRKVTMIVATQKGALPIAELIEAEDRNGKLDVDFTIGQTKPDPASR